MTLAKKYTLAHSHADPWRQKATEQNHVDYSFGLKSPQQAYFKHKTRERSNLWLTIILKSPKMDHFDKFEVIKLEFGHAPLD